MGYNKVKYREECVILQIHFHPDVFMDLFSDSQLLDDFSFGESVPQRDTMDQSG